MSRSVHASGCSAQTSYEKTDSHQKTSEQAWITTKSADNPGGGGGVAYVYVHQPSGAPKAY